MTDRLQALSDQGVSIWLDDLSRERIETGNLAELIKDKRVVGVTTNPTIFAGAIADGERYDDQVARPRRARRRRRRGDLRAHHRATSARPATCCAPVYEPHRRRRRPGLDRGRTRPRARHRRARSPRRATLWAMVDRANVLIKIPATTEGLPAITAALGRGHQRQRHPDLQPRALPRGHGRLPHRARAGAATPASTCRRSARSRRSSSPASTPRSTSGSTRSAPTRRRRCAARPAIANARLAYAAYEEVFACDRWQRLGGRRRQHAASAVGVDGRQGPRPTPTRCTSPSWSSPTPSTRCPRRPSTRSPTTARSTATRSPRSTPTPQQVIDRARGGRHRLRRRVVSARGRGRRQVREVVGRAARHRVRPAGGGASSDRDSLEHRQRAGTGAEFELSSATPTSRRSPRPSSSWSPTASPAGSRPRTPPSGGRTPRPRRPSGSAGSTCRDVAAAARRDRALQAELRETGPRPRRAVRHGRLVAGAGGDLRGGRRRRSRSSTPPTPTSSAPPSRTGSPRRSWSCPASPAARSRPTASGAPSRRRSATPASTRPSGSSWSPTRARPLEKRARDAGYRGLPRRPDVGGRYSALTAFGLVPSGLAGVDIAELLDEAEAIRPALEADRADNPGLLLGAPARRGQPGRRDKIVLADAGSPYRRLRRLGRAADRRVHRQGRQGHPAGRRRGPGRPELRPQHPRRGARAPSART